MSSNQKFFYYKQVMNHMSKAENNIQKQMDVMFTTYVAGLERWKQSYKQWQDAGQKALDSYTQAMQKANRMGDPEMLKKFNELWAETWDIAGKNNPYDWYIRSWENVWKNSGFVTPNAFSDYWQNIWKNSSEEFFKRSVEAMKKMNNL